MIRVTHKPGGYALIEHDSTTIVLAPEEWDELVTYVRGEVNT